MHPQKLFIVLFLIVAASFSAPLLADTSEDQPASLTAEQKTWELGLGVGGVSGPDYRGSSEYSQYLAPIPYFIYRGKYIQSDRDGIRGKLFERESLELNLSVSASITPNSDENSLREDMPELYSTVELGPALNINLTGDTFSSGWFLHLPLRGVIAVGGGDAEYIGWLAHPQLIYREQFSEWSFSYRTGLYYGSEDYHSYYYSVEEQYATVNRPEYHAEAGYSGWSNVVAVSRRFDQFRAALFVKYDSLSGTEFRDSPLVETSNAVSGGFALIWVLH